MNFRYIGSFFFCLSTEPNIRISLCCMIIIKNHMHVNSGMFDIRTT